MTFQKFVFPDYLRNFSEFHNFLILLGNFAQIKPSPCFLDFRNPNGMIEFEKPGKYNLEYITSFLTSTAQKSNDINQFQEISLLNALGKLLPQENKIFHTTVQFFLRVNG